MFSLFVDALSQGILPKYRRQKYAYRKRALNATASSAALLAAVRCLGGGVTVHVPQPASSCSSNHWASLQILCGIRFVVQQIFQFITSDEGFCLSTPEGGWPRYQT